MGDTQFVLHGHFYQPPRENPWTEEVAREASASPFHDWNERITAESYRPNGWARVVDEHGRVTDIVDNFEHLSYDVGPTLMSWLEAHQPDVYARILEADRAGHGAIAQAYGHLILPLANERDRRTQIRWGLADFAHRFGRPARGMWLPETAVDEDVLAALVDEGVGFTILAPSQAVAVRPLDDPDGEWHDVSDGSIRGGEPHRWFHPDGSGRSIDLVFYDGGISHDLAFGLTGLSSQELIRRVVDAAGDGSPVCVATDGETFGHHHEFAERALAYAFAHEAGAAGVQVLNASDLVETVSATHEVRIRTSAWSCVHGVGRWHTDCGCHTGGEPGWNQAWREPLRAALDLLRDAGVEVFERRGVEVLRDPWAARDAYVDVLLGRRTADDLLAEHGVDGLDRDGQVVALTLLEAQRHAMAMYTSCGWFFNDLAGLETVQVLRYAAKTIDLLGELGERPPVDEFLDVLARGRSNVDGEGDGAEIWERHVLPTRVTADRVVGHLALVSLLEARRIPERIAAYEVVEHERRFGERGGLSGVAGRITLEHRRTRRRTVHVYAAVHLGGLEVFGATRPADGDRDTELFVELAHAVSRGERVTTLLRLIADGFGPDEFGLESALPDAADQIVQGAASQLADRFGATYEGLFTDHRALLDSLVLAGYPLPEELRAPAEFALARRLETEVERALTDDGQDPFEQARALVREAAHGGFRLATPRVAATMGHALLTAVDRAVQEPQPAAVEAALTLVTMTRDLGLVVELDRAQELVHDALGSGDGAALRPLGEALGLVV